MKFIAVLFAIFFCFRGHTFVLAPVYRTGEDVCREHAGELESEFSKWIDVPIDYARPALGTTKLYAYTKKAFDYNLPTLIFFTGGPGVSSRATEFSLPHFNVLFFEQRGISCSRPASRELFLNPHFYSSENTAQDPLEIIKHFGLTKVTVYGHSYGTIPATIFASRYPQFTRTLLLEGVVYHADKSLWLAKRRDLLLQNLFDSLPDNEKQKILELSNSGDVPASWFSKIGGMTLYLNNGVSSYRNFLHAILFYEDMELKSFINNFYTDPNKAEDQFSYGDVTMGMIACREMGMSDPRLSLTTVFDKFGKLISDHNNLDRSSVCAPIGLENAYKTSKSYKADSYPVKVPVSYFLGANDGATPSDQGLTHYKKVARAKKQILVMKEGGHLPSLDLLRENRECIEVDGSCDSLKQNQKQVHLFEELALGKKISSALVDDFNRSGELKWKASVSE